MFKDQVVVVTGAQVKVSEQLLQKSLLKMVQH